ncbi:MAG: phosphohistidine phosphatase SixA [Zetaproteobacteria bacterium CG2_30_46_52]|nr:MAG: phosphohistidine phosphatase SixA [Zetaproteobacteria bacterium CG2_30_46_52]
MRIYLVQHGQAVSEDEDPTRPLTSQGREDITRVAGFLSLFEKPKPKKVVHSGKLRAKQSAQMFAEAWQVSHIEEDGDLSPNAMPEIWRDRLANMDEDIMLVGHLPHLGKLVSLLVQQDSDKATVLFRNGGCLCLERAGDAFHMLWHINPTLFYPHDLEL